LVGADGDGERAVGEGENRTSSVSECGDGVVSIQPSLRRERRGRDKRPASPGVGFGFLSFDGGSVALVFPVHIRDEDLLSYEFFV
jgi:hypothetical protein